MGEQAGRQTVRRGGVATYDAQSPLRTGNSATHVAATALIVKPRDGTTEATRTLVRGDPHAGA